MPNDEQRQRMIEKGCVTCNGMPRYFPIIQSTVTEKGKQRKLDKIIMYLPVCETHKDKNAEVESAVVNYARIIRHMYDKLKTEVIEWPEIATFDFEKFYGET